eukprot:TRINITY_DN18036_c0_g2_i1.p1 TRINITY_DN18036_c0_g2~~TRINITY_DN18036_c0_g2_i1.p1  ORF type:complete len:383 (+),score=83.81 TRINITY_DN18036_c0_g2_i1:75-1151(+)
MAWTGEHVPDVDESRLSRSTLWHAQQLVGGHPLGCLCFEAAPPFLAAGSDHAPPPAAPAQRAPAAAVATAGIAEAGCQRQLSSELKPRPVAPLPQRPDPDLCRRFGRGGRRRARSAGGTPRGSRSPPLERDRHEAEQLRGELRKMQLELDQSREENAFLSFRAERCCASLREMDVKTEEIQARRVYYRNLTEKLTAGLKLAIAEIQTLRGHAAMIRSLSEDREAALVEWLSESSEECTELHYNVVDAERRSSDLAEKSEELWHALREEVSWGASTGFQGMSFGGVELGAKKPRLQRAQADGDLEDQRHGLIALSSTGTVVSGSQRPGAGSAVGMPLGGCPDFWGEDNAKSFIAFLKAF